MRIKLLICFVISLLLLSCTKPYDKKANTEYVKDKCGKLIFSIKEKWGNFPVSIGDKNNNWEWDSSSGQKGTIPVFKDKYGRPVKYVWVDTNSFYFICTGPKDIEDYKIVYDNGWKN